VNSEAKDKFTILTDRDTHVLGHHCGTVLDVTRKDLKIDGRKA
jgi:hypothetical protein